MSDLYVSQRNLFDPENEGDDWNIHVFGVGSTGSHVVANLAKTGFKNIHIYDYDVVEEKNVPAQFYSYHYIGVSKCEALRQIVKDFTGTNLIVHEGKVDDSLTIKTDNNIFILAFDTIEGRQMLLKKFEGSFIIDARIGGWNYQVFVENFKINKELRDSLNGEMSEEPCGSKGLWTVNTMIASEIVGILLKHVKGKKLPTKILGNIMGNTRICKEED